MGHQSNDERIHFLQQATEASDFIATPHPADDAMTDTANELVAFQNNTNTPPGVPNNTPVETTEPVSPDANTDIPQASDTQDEHSTPDPNTTLLIPITNPSAFPLHRIQEVQSQHYPSTRITSMLCHLSPHGTITQVTADMDSGSINHLIIRDARLINALGLHPPHYDTMALDSSRLKLDETFRIRILPGQRPERLEEWIMGELVSARHAYLYWLDERRTADPRHGPYAAEAKVIARRTGRRWMDVMREVERVWELEQGSDGEEYRGNRVGYLGEDPVYEEGAEEGRVVRSMFV